MDTEHCIFMNYFSLTYPLSFFLLFPFISSSFPILSYLQYTVEDKNDKEKLSDPGLTAALDTRQDIMEPLPPMPKLWTGWVGLAVPCILSF